jgi:hypothetical protein
VSEERRALGDVWFPQSQYIGISTLKTYKANKP